MENWSREAKGRSRPAAFRFVGSKCRRERQDLPMKLASLIAPGAAILPFAAVLALCVSLLALPSSERAFVTYPTLPRVSELQALPPAGAPEPSGTSVPQAPPAEVGASPPVAARSVAATTSDPVSQMSTWWSGRSRHHKAVPPKQALFPRQSRRHQYVFRREQGCPPSVCSNATPILPDPRRWEHLGN